MDASDKKMLAKILEKLSDKLKGGQKGGATGIIKTFNRTKGIGFITPDNGDHDFVINHSQIVKGYKPLTVGQQVTFDIIKGPKGKQAANIQPA